MTLERQHLRCLESDRSTDVGDAMEIVADGAFHTTDGKCNALVVVSS